MVLVQGCELYLRVKMYDCTMPLPRPRLYPCTLPTAPVSRSFGSDIPTKSIFPFCQQVGTFPREMKLSTGYQVTNKK